MLKLYFFKHNVSDLRHTRISICLNNLQEVNEHQYNPHETDELLNTLKVVHKMFVDIVSKVFKMVHNRSVAEHC